MSKSKKTQNRVKNLTCSTVPREVFDSSVTMPFFPGVLWLLRFLYSVDPHPVSSLHIYPLLCRGYSRWVRLAKQETLTPPGHLVSPLVCRGPWISSVVLYCWCHSDSASVLLYFKFGREQKITTLLPKCFSIIAMHVVCCCSLPV